MPGVARVVVTDDVRALAGHHGIELFARRKLTAGGRAMPSATLDFKIHGTDRGDESVKEEPHPSRERLPETGFSLNTQ